VDDSTRAGRRVRHGTSGMGEGCGGADCKGMGKGWAMRIGPGEEIEEVLRDIERFDGVMRRRRSPAGFVERMRRRSDSNSDAGSNVDRGRRCEVTPLRTGAFAYRIG